METNNSLRERVQKLNYYLKDIKMLIAIALARDIDNYPVNITQNICNYLNLAESKTAPLLLTRSIVNLPTVNHVRS